jgi:excisionase family DNA binding protein
MDQESDRTRDHLSPREVAKKVDVSVHTVRNWCHGGQLPSTRLVGLGFKIDPRDLVIAHRLAAPILAKRARDEAARIRNTP